jgi:RAB protein geranylgeranyltransferase component A
MYKTTVEANDNSALLTRDQLREYLQVGKETAEKIARAAGAKVHLGRAVRYNREKIRKYIDSMEN